MPGGWGAFVRSAASMSEGRRRKGRPAVAPVRLRQGTTPISLSRLTATFNPVSCVSGGYFVRSGPVVDIRIDLRS